MNTKAIELIRRASVGGVAGAVMFLAPVPALAEEAGGGMELLMPHLAEFVPACIAFAIIWFIMAKFVWPVVMKTLADREEKIRGDIEAAEQSRQEAEEDARKSAACISDAQREAAEIVSTARREAEDERARIMEKAHEDAAEVLAKAHGVVELERRKAMDELSAFAVELGVEIAGKIIGSDLSEDEQRKLAEKYLAEVGALDV